MDSDKAIRKLMKVGKEALGKKPEKKSYGAGSSSKAPIRKAASTPKSFLPKLAPKDASPSLPKSAPTQSSVSALKGSLAMLGEDTPSKESEGALIVSGKPATLGLVAGLQCQRKRKSVEPSKTPLKRIKKKGDVEAAREELSVALEEDVIAVESAEVVMAESVSGRQVETTVGEREIEGTAVKVSQKISTSFPTSRANMRQTLRIPGTLPQPPSPRVGKGKQVLEIGGDSSGSEAIHVPPWTLKEEESIMSSTSSALKFLDGCFPAGDHMKLRELDSSGMRMELAASLCKTLTLAWEESRRCKEAEANSLSHDETFASLKTVAEERLGTIRRLEQLVYHRDMHAATHKKLIREMEDNLLKTVGELNFVRKDYEERGLRIAELEAEVRRWKRKCRSIEREVGEAVEVEEAGAGDEAIAVQSDSDNDDGGNDGDNTAALDPDDVGSSEAEDAEE